MTEPDATPLSSEASKDVAPAEDTIDEDERADCAGPAGATTRASVADDRSRHDDASTATSIVVDDRIGRDEGDEVEPRCARCKRPGIEDGTPTEARRSRRVRYPRRTGRSPWAMTANEGARACPVATIQTTLSRARCLQPAQIERMKQSLATHGQLTPLVTTARAGEVEVIDGFKRLAAATTLEWATLLVVVRPLDETGQWAAMLVLNQGPSSMTTLEQALVLRELVATGLTQSEIGALCRRHKTWVSRRIGLVDRLHPELVEAMKLGLLHPGSARRLLSLPPGNQLEMAAAIGKAKLGPRETELLVTLWRRTKAPAERRVLLAEPKASLMKHHPETRRPVMDLRLSPGGQHLSRCLQRIRDVEAETSRRMKSRPPATDLEILDTDLRRAAAAASRLAIELGSARTVAGASETDESGETN